MISPQHLSKCGAASLLVIPVYRSVTGERDRMIEDFRGLWIGVERNKTVSHTIPCL